MGCMGPLCSFWFCNHLAEEEKTGCLALVMFLPSCDCLYVCFVSLPRGVVG